jgi:hypothetical protein
MVQRELKIVRLLNPQMCLGCSFAKLADVEDAYGERSRMIQCQRLDCDNWDTSSAAAVGSVRQMEE